MLLSLRGCFSGEFTSRSQKMGCDWGEVTSYFKVAANTIALKLIPRDLRKHLLFWNGSALPTPHLTPREEPAQNSGTCWPAHHSQTQQVEFSSLKLLRAKRKAKCLLFVEAWLYSEHGNLHQQFRKHAQSQWGRIKCTLTENNWKFSSLS